MDGQKRSARAVYWQGVIDEHRRSGLSVAAFCKDRNVSLQSFYQWRRKFFPKVNTDSSLSFLVPVKLTPPPATNRSIQIFTPHGYCIRLNAGFTMNEVSELLRAVEGTLDRGDAC